VAHGPPHEAAVGTGSGRIMTVSTTGMISSAGMGTRADEIGPLARS
jgi:hypothetical protein